MIHSILTNPTYTGDLAQGRSRVKSYKVHQIEAVPREEWVEVAGTHEAIIDYETFDKVQALLQRDTRTSPKGREVHLFSGFLKCADCGRAITRCVGKNNNVYYSCSTYKNRSRTACTMHSIKHERLEAAVCSLYSIRYIWLFPTRKSSRKSIPLQSKKPVLPTGRSDSCKRAGTDKDNTLQAISLSGLERR